MKVGLRYSSSNPPDLSPMALTLFLKMCLEHFQNTNTLTTHVGTVKSLTQTQMC